jgi:hypothetical protein
MTASEIPVASARPHAHTDMCGGSPRALRVRTESGVLHVCKRCAWSLVMTEAESRSRRHRDHRSSRPFSDGYDYIGLCGEAAFAVRYDLVLDLTPRPAGDGHIDFRAAGLTIDVKTARIPNNLIVEYGVPVADVLVLAQWTVSKVRLLGWEWGVTLLGCPVKDFGYGVKNHYTPRASLRNMRELDRTLDRYAAD